MDKHIIVFGGDIMDKDLETIQQEIESRRQAEANSNPTTALAPTTQKAISQVGVEDIQLTLDKTRSLEEQANDIVGAMATARAVQDEETAEELAEFKMPYHLRVEDYGRTYFSNKEMAKMFEFIISISSNKVKAPKIMGNKTNGLA